MLVETLTIAALTFGALSDAPSPAAAPQLGDAQLVGQRIVTGFEGQSVPGDLRRRIAAGRLGGVILFDSNFGSRSGAQRLIAELQAIDRPRGLRDPLLVMVDQEGGLVKRLPGPPSLSAEQMGAAGRATCRRQGAKTGQMLRRTGVNVDLAPVLDVARPGSVMDDENRSFGSDPDLVGACGGAFAAALERGGVAPTAKHFPGLGAASLNTDAAVQRIDLGKSKLRRTDEAPYREFAGGGARGRLVMLSSAIYTAFSDRPAAFDAAITRGELRRRLGFRGVSVTDALETASTEAFGGPTRAARLAARAGADLLLFAGFDAAKRAARSLRELTDGGRSRERFLESVGRVLDLRARLPGG
jgi:beta-N-acetylhexosaminidase